ncbi:MAG: YkgJ family cysteine cluster protein [Myxococcales bacterium]|nr:YkgJ family cysteine cluster protein [Myxococcales bacterium]
MASGLHLARLLCTGCGECCRALSVPLTFEDLARLIAATALAPEEVIEWASPEQVDVSGEPSCLVLLPAGRRVMVLRQEGGACRFLDRESRCEVHDARPRACRAYPLHATFGSRGGLRRLRVLRGVACPYQLTAVGDLARVRREHAALGAELAQHYAAVAAWNRFQEHRRRLGRPLASAGELWGRVLQPQLSQPISDMPMQP